MTFLIFFTWFYKEIPALIFRFFQNLVVFLHNFFSISILFRTFFWPYRRYVLTEETFFKRIIFDFFSRMIGVFVRFWTILAGLFFEFIAILIGILTEVVWVLLPAIFAVGFIVGIGTILS